MSHSFASAHGTAADSANTGPAADPALLAWRSSGFLRFIEPPAAFAISSTAPSTRKEIRAKNIRSGRHILLMLLRLARLVGDKVKLAA
jgi:hypothetical protein